MESCQKAASRPSVRGVPAGALRRWILALTLSLFASTSPAAVRYQVLAQFPATTAYGDFRLGWPSGGMFVSPDGTIYGMAGTGYEANVAGGGLYSVTPAGTFSALHTLQPTEGSVAAPIINYYPGLGLAPDGSMYGITFRGGPAQSSSPSAPAPMGTVFRYANGQWTTLHTFYGSSVGDGAKPLGVTLGADGNYYGVTSDGGSNAVLAPRGVAFQLTPNGTERVIYTFMDNPPSSFVLGADGNIYGTLPAGWQAGTQLTPSQFEAFFKLSTDGTFTILYQFNPSVDGSGVHNLVQGSDGNFYGTAAGGGSYSNGTVFKLTPIGQFTLLHSFGNGGALEGISPGALVMATDGDIYGATERGSNGGMGSIFRLSTTGTFTLLHTFNGSAATGSAPLSIVQHGPRTFYGTAGGSMATLGPAGVYKMVVSFRDDVTALGRSSVLAFGPGAYSSSFIDATGVSQVVSTTIAAGYYPAAVGDFNGDGVADILWTSANNDLYIWFGKAGGYTAQYAGTYPAGWSVVGAGDVNGDGMDDLLWLNQSTHQFAYWLMNGATRTSFSIINIAAGYYPAAIGDFDGDGRADVLWTSANHDLYLWTSTGGGFKSSYITTYPANWKIVGRGDLDGDGRDDLIWMSNDGQSWGYWLMNGPAIEAIVPASVPASLSGYRIVATADYNADGAADILWSNGQNLVLWSSMGSCSPSLTCTFNTSAPPVAAPAGQQVFNSGVPVITP
ncbi:choice-of-anchor tandem repeat GloVer-containing protein [Dyella silvae]|uniref:choice-of-anchor tandem repeat GloVer-containing protein n=1 Tax=Dyella silvae TaxID=2994424 RepID=UPI0022656747|nr:choice-of-anchor tandem repeat GloVer-containing protein [Dyella silvae]